MPRTFDRSFSPVTGHCFGRHGSAINAAAQAKNTNYKVWTEPESFADAIGLLVSKAADLFITLIPARGADREHRRLDAAAHYPHRADAAGSGSSIWSLWKSRQPSRPSKAIWRSGPCWAARGPWKSCAKSSKPCNKSNIAGFETGSLALASLEGVKICQIKTLYCPDTPDFRTSQYS